MWTHIRRSFGIPSLARDDLSQLFLVPLVHRIGSLLVLLLSGIRVDVGFADFTFDLLVVRELASVTCQVQSARR